jgi:competence ComEA-like helix-hairpin-helix protein
MKTLKIRLEKFIKKYFYFSPSEQKGIMLLTLILVLVIFTPFIYRLVKPTNDLVINIQQFKALDSLDKSTSNSEDFTTQDPFEFNPNSATAEELKQLGFTDKNIATLQSYLNKGGKIKSVEDLKKIYGIDEKLVTKLTPFLLFEKQQENSNSKHLIDTLNYAKKEKIQVLEINTADSVSLVKLYRIGPKLAAKIIAYREKLGGFLNLHQLTEIYGFDEDILYDLKDKITVDASKAKLINLNTITEEELKNHPYFKYKLARVITNYRNQHGKYNSYNDLLKIKLMNDSILDRIKIYGVIE